MLHTREGVTVMYTLPVLLGQKLDRATHHGKVSQEQRCQYQYLQQLLYFMRNLTSSSTDTPVQIGRLINVNLSCLNHRAATL